MSISHVWRLIFACSAVMAANTGLTDSLDLNLNDDAARLIYAKPIYEGRLEVDGGWFHHQDRGDVWSLSLTRAGEAGGGTQAITAGLGGRLAILDPKSAAGTSSQDGFALGVGGFFRMKLVNYDRIGFAAHAYFSPDVLAFGDVQDYTEATARVTYSIIRDAEVYLGLRYMQAGFKNVDAKFDTGLHIGLRLEF